MSVEFKEGQHVIYKGHQAKVVSVEPSGNFIILEFNGQCHRVDKRHGIFNFENEYAGDTFSKRIHDEVVAECDKRIAASDAYIEKKEEEKAIFKKIEEAAKETRKKCRKAITAILARFNAKSEKEINDVGKQREYLALMEDSSKARRAERRAITDFLTANSLIQNENYYKSDTLNTKMVVNAIANSQK